MKIACCLACKRVIAAGQLPSEVTSKEKKEKIPYIYKHEVIDENGIWTIHEGKLLDLPDTIQGTSESPGDYLKRLWKLHENR